MSTPLERQAIAAPLVAYERANGLSVDWPNRMFVKPAAGPWVRFTVLDTLGSQIEMGSTNNTHRVYGSLIMQVFVPVDSGDGAALALGDALGELYRQKILNFSDVPPSGMVRMRDPVVKTIGNSDEAYYQVNVLVPFHRDDLL